MLGWGGHPFWVTHFQHANNMAGDEKSIPALNVNILWDIAGSIPHLVPPHFLGIDFPPFSPSKNTGSALPKNIVTFLRKWRCMMKLNPDKSINTANQYDSIIWQYTPIGFK